MKKKIATLLCAAAMLAACSKNDDGVVAEPLPGPMAGQSTPVLSDMSMPMVEQSTADAVQDAAAALSAAAATNPGAGATSDLGKGAVDGTHGGSGR